MTLAEAEEVIKRAEAVARLLNQVAAHDWRVSFLAHTSDTAEEAAWAIHALIRVLKSSASIPVDMILSCPACGYQHVDAPNGDWNNPPHKSHLCHNCKTIWRHSDAPTNGVAAIKTRGAADTWTYLREFVAKAQSASIPEGCVVVPRDDLRTAVDLAWDGHPSAASCASLKRLAVMLTASPTREEGK